jgi:hypothetical protein
MTLTKEAAAEIVVTLWKKHDTYIDEYAAALLPFGKSDMSFAYDGDPLIVTPAEIADVTFKADRARAAVELNRILTDFVTVPDILINEVESRYRPIGYEGQGLGFSLAYRDVYREVIVAFTQPSEAD